MRGASGYNSRDALRINWTCVGANVEGEYVGVAPCACAYRYVCKHRPQKVKCHNGN